MNTDFIKNINEIKAALPAIKEASKLFDEKLVARLEGLASLDLSLISEDLAKGNYLGNRKIDIDLSLNNSNSETEVTYKSANIVLNNGINLSIAFERATEENGKVIEEIGSYTGLYTKITEGIAAYNTNEANVQLHVVNYEIDVINETIENLPTLLRVRDTDGNACNIDRITLSVYGGGSAKELNPTYFWTKTTSALEVLANRVGDIIALGEDIDKIIALADKEDEVQYLYDIRAKLESLHTNIDKIIAVANNEANINAVNANKTNIDAVKENESNINTTALNNVNITKVAEAIAKVIAVADNEANINTVEANETNINTTALNDANITKVADAIAKVIAVADNEANINTVKANETNINTTALNDANITKVADAILKVIAVADNEANIDAVEANETNINTTALNDANITKVADAIAKVIAVADNEANIDTVSSDIEKVKTVSLNISDIKEAVGDLPSIIQVVANKANIDTIALSITGLNAISDNLVGINTVKQNISEINTASDNISNIIATAQNKLNINAVANNQNNININAINESNISAVAAAILSINAVHGNKANIDDVVLNMDDIKSAKTNADTATSKASEALISANNAQNFLEQITQLSVSAVHLLETESASAMYNSSTGLLQIGIPQGKQGEKGEAFTVDASDNIANRTAYDGANKGFSFLSLDENPTKIYFKKSATSGDWTVGVPFGKGDKGDKGNTGVGISNIARTSGNGAAGTVDTYTITYTNASTSTFQVTNGTGNIIVSVNGKTGTVVLTKNDVGLGNVDNTSDINKPISTAQQAELDTKADKNSTYSKTEVTNYLNQKQDTLTFDTTPKNGSNNPLTSDAIYDALVNKSNTGHSHSISNITDLQNQLNSKASNHSHPYLGSNANAVSASKLLNARTISVGGDLSGSASFDGSSNITINATVKDDSHNHTIANIDGLQAFMNSVNTILLSDKSNLDTIQEIVDFIELNKSSLDSLGISNIAGLQTALNGKVNNNQVLTNVPAGAKFTDTNTWRAIADYLTSTSTSASLSANQGRILKNLIDGKAPNHSHPYLGSNANAVSASKLLNARTITLGGDLTGSANFDGSSNITITVSVKDDSHNHTISNIDNLQNTLNAKAALNGNSGQNFSVKAATSASHAANLSQVQALINAIDIPSSYDVTVLADYPSRKYNGTITLAESIQNFNLMVVENYYGGIVTFKILPISALVVNTLYEIFSDDARYARWYYTNATTFTHYQESGSWIRKIYGIGRK